MFSQTERGVYKDQVHWFVGVDAAEPILHITLWDNTLQHIHYYFEELNGPLHIELGTYFEKFRKEIYGPNFDETNRLLEDGK